MGLKQTIWYALFLSLFLTIYELYGQSIWNAWLKAQGFTNTFLGTMAGYMLTIFAALFARALAWRYGGK